MELTDVGFVSHLIAALGFAALAVSVLARRALNGTNLWLAIAALTTAAWAGDFVMAARFGGPYLALLSPAETFRTAAWIGFLVSLLRSSWQLDSRLSSSFIIASAIGFVLSVQIGIDLVDFLGHGVSLHERPIIATLFVVGRLTVAISGLVLLHNLYVNAESGSRTGIRLLCIGLAGFLGYDLNLYTLEFLLGTPSRDLYNIRGAVDVLTVPLLLLSAREAWVARVQVSRQVVFHTLSMSIIGGYLIAMALLAYGLRLVGGDWGRLLQITFLFATITLGALVLLLPRFQAALRLLIARNFFAYRYDYRVEWLRFIRIVSGAAGVGHLPERVVEAICTVVDSPGGALYAPGEDGAFDVVAKWNWRAFVGTPIAVDGSFVSFLANKQWVIDLDELRSGDGSYGTLPIPSWVEADRGAWLIVPLLHLDSLRGFLVVERTLAPRTLGWEDFELLRTLGRQAASYIAEATSQAELDEAGKFDEFNRRFAFIMHDIKNLVSQLSLVARNAERHADNPAFRADMVATLQGSVGKMNDLLARLAQRTAGRAENDEAVDLGPLIADLVSLKSRQHEPLTFSHSSEQCFVIGDPVRFEALFGHLIQNAIDASSPGAPIAVELRCEPTGAVVTISDSGCGMSAAFLRNQLFKPFKSTKPGGFGIGAYEAREIARAAGGRLDVASREGEGTVFTIHLPLAKMLVTGRSRAGAAPLKRIIA